MKEKCLNYATSGDPDLNLKRHLKTKKRKFPILLVISEINEGLVL